MDSTTDIITGQENQTVSKVIMVTPVLALIAAAYSLIRHAIDKGFHVEAGYKNGYLRINPNQDRPESQP